MLAMPLENGNYLQILICICPPEESEGIQLQILEYIYRPWITAFIPGSSSLLREEGSFMS